MRNNQKGIPSQDDTNWDQRKQGTAQMFGVIIEDIVHVYMINKRAFLPTPISLAYLSFWGSHIGVCFLKTKSPKAGVNYVKIPDFKILTRESTGDNKVERII